MKIQTQKQCDECEGEGNFKLMTDFGVYERFRCDICLGDGWYIEYIDIESDPNDLLKELLNVD